jgi:hypothetical protein
MLQSRSKRRKKSYTQSVGLLGRGITMSQGCYLNTRQHKHRHPCFKWDSNPRSQRLSERRQFMPQTARLLWSAGEITIPVKYDNCTFCCSVGKAVMTKEKESFSSSTLNSQFPSKVSIAYVTVSTTILILLWPKYLWMALIRYRRFSDQFVQTIFDVLTLHFSALISGTFCTGLCSKE